MEIDFFPFGGLLYGLTEYAFLIVVGLIVALAVGLALFDEKKRVKLNKVTMFVFLGLYAATEILIDMFVLDNEVQDNLLLVDLILFGSFVGFLISFFVSRRLDK